jgi:Tfp pilus assembly protein PilV
VIVATRHQDWRGTKTVPHMQSVQRAGRLGFTLAEVVISAAIAALGIGGMVWGYILTAQRAEWSACSAAAHSLAMGRLEQTRAARWDPLAYPEEVDELVESNFNSNVVAALNLPLAGTNTVDATTTVTIKLINTNPPLKMIRVDCVWSVLSRGPFTNTLTTYRSPDQ